jgi:hypothetical protein
MSTVIVNSLGQIAGWNNVTVRALGRDFVGVSRVQYGETYEDENLYGAGDYPIGHGRGNALPTAAIDLYEEEVQKLRELLPAGKRLRDIDPFQIIVTYQYKERTVTDVIMGCRFTGASKEITQGQKGIITSFPLLCTEIRENV